MTGAKSREEVYQAFEMVYPVLKGEYICPALNLALFEGWLTIIDHRKGY